MSVPTRALSSGLVPTAAPRRAVAPRALRATAAAPAAASAAALPARPAVAARCTRAAAAAAAAQPAARRSGSVRSGRGARLVAASSAPAASGEQWWTAHSDIFTEVPDSEALNALLTAAPANQARHYPKKRLPFACALCHRVRRRRRSLLHARGASRGRLAHRRARSWWWWSGCRRPARCAPLRSRAQLCIGASLRPNNRQPTRCVSASNAPTTHPPLALSALRSTAPRRWRAPPPLRRRCARPTRRRPLRASRARHPQRKPSQRQRT
jgi:hypothetical protein